MEFTQPSLTPLLDVWDTNDTSNGTKRSKAWLESIARVHIPLTFVSLNQTRYLVAGILKLFRNVPWDAAQSLNLNRVTAIWHVNIAADRYWKSCILWVWVNFSHASNEKKCYNIIIYKIILNSVNLEQSIACRPITMNKKRRVLNLSIRLMGIGSISSNALI